jgi:hypothetical protein
MITSYKIVNQLGKIISQNKVTIPKNHLYIDINGYEKGIYFVSVFNDGDKIATNKIIVK